MFTGASSGTGGGFGGFGASNNNNQTGNTGGSVFGSGTGFGQPAATGFGNTGGGFGQQQNTSNAFGTATTTNTGFGGTSGGFGATNNAAASPFGAAKPFGGTSQPGTGGLFGSNNSSNTTSGGTGFGFGGANNTSNVFGGGNTAAASGGGLFGNSKPTFGPATTTAGTTGGLFGTANSGAGGAFGGGANTAIGFSSGTAQGPLTGTANPPYTAFTEKEAQGNTTNHFQTIAFMPAYKNWSLEELRLQDYVQGRRYGTDSGNSGAFGQGTQFGAAFGTTNNSNPSGFGAANSSATTSGGLFGNTANNNTTSTPFGATNTGGGFGAGANQAGGGGLFGANKPATGGLFGAPNNTTATGSGGLFGAGANNTTTGAFGGGNTTGTFGATGATGATGGLFGAANNNNNQQAQKPFSFGNTGSGFGGGASNTTFNAQGNNATSTGGGLFGNTQSTAPAFGATQAGAGFGGTGGAFGTAGQNQGGTAFGAFGNNQPQNKPFGAGFGATQATTATGGGGLFGNNNQQQQQQNTGGLFGGGDNKPFGPPAISTGVQGGGLFGNNSTATGGTAGGGLFGGGQATQAAQGGLFGGGGGANTGSGGLFGNNANKPPGAQGGGLFSNAGPPASASGSLFGGSALGGSQLNTSTGGGFFNNQQQQPQQQQQMASNSLFGSQFGGGLQGQQQQQQGFTASIMDSPYVNPVLNSSLGNVPNSPMGPIATPLSSSVQTKRAAMIPHYKIAPRQPSLAPRLGNSFSRSGSPFAASSGSHATLGNSGSLGRSFSSTNKLHLFDGDDSILNSSSFTPNTSSRVASLKRLVIDKKIRDQDLFSGGQDLRKDNSGGSDFAGKGGTKSILKKTVSFDIATNRRGEEELYGVGTTSAKGKETVGPNPTAEEMGLLRSTPEGRRSREVEETSNGSTSANNAPVIGNEVAIISEKPKDDKSPGTYWMVPSASRLKMLPKEQQKRVMNLTIGRRGYGQVRFDNPVDISEIEDIDKIPGHIVLFAQRVCTVYPETMPKPPPGKGLNVPATITLEDCFPVSKNERGKIRDPEHPRYVTHIRRLKSIKDTEFVNYLANEGMWIFRVRHFTTYGLVESDDEEEDGDYTVDESTMLPTGETPTPIKTPGSSLWDGDEESSMDADASGIDNTSSYDDTFDFKKFGSSAIASRSNRDQYSSFLSRNDRETSYGESEEEGDVTMDQSFLGEGSVGSIEDMDEPAEPGSDQSEEEVDTTIVVDDETDGDVTGVLVLANSHVLSPVKEYEEEDTITQDTPAKPLPMGQDWTEQLNNTISPKKRRFGGESFMASTRKLANSPVKKFNIEPMSYGLLDLANDLYGGRASGINGNSTKGKGKAAWDQVESPTSSRYQHENAWTATKNGKSDAGTVESDDKRWRNAIKPVWGKDGSIIYFGDLEGLERRRNYGNDLKLAKLKYSVQDPESQGTPKPLELQLRATTIKRDEFNVPVAELKMDTLFHSFTQLSWSPDDPAGQHEKSVWELASVLWDPITGELALEEESQEMIEYMQETCRKERLSKFLEALVEAAADEHVHGATTLEEVAIAHLAAHRVEQACASLLEGGDFRLANLTAMVGGDSKLRSSIKKQLEQWKNKGVLSEIPISIRALYELLAGNTCYSEGVRGPPEDTASDFFISDRFNLDWKRGFGLKLWYGCADEDPIGNAVVDYETDMREYPEAVPAPKPWYHTDTNPARDDAIDILWGLLKLYADRELNLEEVLAPMNMTTNYIDYRLSWQLRTILAKKGIRDFSGGKLHRRIDGTDEFIAGSMADQITIDFAGELETLGMWEWAVFVLLHLTDTDSRETAIRSVIGKHMDELESAEGADVGKKLEFLEKTLLIPRNWIYEARALQARSAGRHLLEAGYLLAAQAWNEAHKTIVQKVAPEAVISGDLENLKLILAEFEDVDLVDKWNLGGQIYLDYIHLQEYVLSGKLHLGPAKNAPEQKGLPKSNSPKDLARRLLVGLKNADRKGFLQNIAVREMAGVVGSWVLKSEDMISEAPKLLELPLTEDQFLRKTVNLGLTYYKARLQEVR